MFVDRTGRQINLGDVVIAPRVIRQHGYLDIGKVVKINPKSIKIAAIADMDSQYKQSVDGFQWVTYRVPPYIRGASNVMKPERVIVIDSSTLPSDYQKVIEAVRIDP